jgi:hypothetical protein
MLSKLSHDDELDTFVPSLRKPDWKSNTHCSIDKPISKRRVVPMAPPHAAQTNCLSVLQNPMHSQVRNDSPHRLLLVVSSFHLQCLEESHRHHFDGVLPTQIEDAHGSVNEVIRECWTVPLALSPTIQMRDSPVSHNLTCPCTHYDSTDGPGLAVFSFPPCGPRPEGVEPWQSGVKRCSVTKIANERWTVPTALSSHIQVTNIPVSPDLTQPPTHYKSLYGPQVAIPSINLRFPRESCRSHHLDGIKSCRNDELSFSVKKNVSNQCTVPPVQSPGEQVTNLPVSH